MTNTFDADLLARLKEAEENVYTDTELLQEAAQALCEAQSLLREWQAGLQPVGNYTVRLRTDILMDKLGRLPLSKEQK